MSGQSAVLSGVTAGRDEASKEAEGSETGPFENGAQGSASQLLHADAQLVEPQLANQQSSLPSDAAQFAAGQRLSAGGVNHLGAVNDQQSLSAVEFHASGGLAGHADPSHSEIGLSSGTGLPNVSADLAAMLGLQHLQSGVRDALFDFEPDTHLVSEEIHYSKGDLALCFLVNRRTRAMRIIDFRSGSQNQKAELIKTVAAAEGIERAFVVVEREESALWSRMGFQKEGSIPGFYKRSDAYILGRSFEDRSVLESGTRIRSLANNAKPGSDRGERAYQAGRRLVRAKAPETLPKVKVALAKEKDIAKATNLAQRTGRALTEFEHFGRDVEEQRWLCTARGGFSLLVGLEENPCFDNAYLDLLAAPRGEKEIWLTAAALQNLGDEMLEAGIVSAFSITPASSVELTAAFVLAGYRRTCRLPEHLVLNGQRVDAFLWSRRLAEVK
ncbi:MAG: hypothetical protein MK135_01350 [Polyangiaceae bacterium]|nr:hypothetical protein [Polyangiaceae bacterium]